MIAFFHWFVKITGYIPQRLVFRTKVYYEDKSVQSRRIKGKAIVICNHQTLYDFAVLLFLFPGRTLRALAAEVLYDGRPLLGTLLKCFGMIRVDRDAMDFSFIDRCAGILDKGGVIEIYPEARLPKAGEERPLPFKPSAAYLALETDTPIIPVYSTGKLFCKERNRVIIGAPIHPRELADDRISMTQNVANLTERLRGKIIELQQQLEERVAEEEKDRK
ncbi:MAG: 1-acyl-sn-glycerol-3-phosphate acyltransferase [Clostridia bacterium]|nr:1-acyl-sn-glycerol-3-phosphate acyltransferase [Clostridia bacterium]